VGSSQSQTTITNAFSSSSTTAQSSTSAPKTPPNKLIPVSQATKSLFIWIWFYILNASGCDSFIVCQFLLIVDSEERSGCEGGQGEIH